MGRKTAAMAPSRMITMDITHARTGRSMKKRASTAGLLSGVEGQGAAEDRTSILDSRSLIARLLHVNVFYNLELSILHDPSADSRRSGRGPRGGRGRCLFPRAAPSDP